MNNLYSLQWYNSLSKVTISTLQAVLLPLKYLNVDRIRVSIGFDLHAFLQNVKIGVI